MVQAAKLGWIHFLTGQDLSKTVTIVPLTCLPLSIHQAASYMNEMPFYGMHLLVQRMFRRSKWTSREHGILWIIHSNLTFNYSDNPRHCYVPKLPSSSRSTGTVIQARMVSVWLGKAVHDPCPPKLQRCQISQNSALAMTKDRCHTLTSSVRYRMIRYSAPR